MHLPSLSTPCALVKVGFDFLKGLLQQLIQEIRVVHLWYALALRKVRDEHYEVKFQKRLKEGRFS